MRVAVNIQYMSVLDSPPPPVREIVGVIVCEGQRGRILE